MSRLDGMRLAIAGAGVVGLCVALETALAGASVEVWDPETLGRNASGVAAGMIAPLGECLFDHPTEESWRLFSAARDLWPPVETRVPGLGLSRPGANYQFADAEALDRALDRLGRWGAMDKVCREGKTRLTSLEDWRLDPPVAMEALAAAVVRAGGAFRSSSLSLQDFGRYDHVVICAGIGARRLAGRAPELSRLIPIKGHIIRFQEVLGEGPTVRTDSLYFAPQPGGLLVGATMERNEEDPAVVAEVVERLRRGAVEHRPDLAGQRAIGAAGVRAATPDGLPMVGPLSGTGLFAAVGLLRNGWLLAPLVAQILLSYLMGAKRGPFDAALDPGRFLVSDSL